MSPESEAQKVIAISLGKIASSRIQRGGPKLCKNLLVANLIHKARTLVEDPYQCCYREQVRDVTNSSSSLNSQISAPADSFDLDVTDVPYESEMSSTPSIISSSEDDLTQETYETSIFQCDDKENDSPFSETDECPDNQQPSLNPRLYSDLPFSVKPLQVPSRCLKRRNSCSERKPDFEVHRSPKRVCDQRPSAFKKLHPSELLDVTTLGHVDEISDSRCAELCESMDVEHISTLVSAFSNSFKDFCCTAEEEDESANGKAKQRLWKASTVSEMVLCAQQATNVLKMRQQSFETTTAVVA